MHPTTDNLNFWKNLPVPFILLAPMEDVTDTVFREIVLSEAVPGFLHVVFTEFTSIDGLLDPRGRSRVAHRLLVSDSEKKLLEQKGIKIVVQIWGSDPEKFYRASRFISNEYPFDGIDINMGCPVKKIVKNNACSALINFPETAGEIIDAVKSGTTLPVSVKTRLGYNKIQTDEWVTNLLRHEPAAITLHGRTQKMMSEGKVNWQEIEKAVRLRNTLSPGTKIIGNGDVDSYGEAHAKCKEYFTDGIMMGRAVFKDIKVFAPFDPAPYEKTDLLRKHIELFTTTWGTTKSFNILKKYFKIYLKNFLGASSVRQQLYDAGSAAEAMAILNRLTSRADFSYPVALNRE